MDTDAPEPDSQARFELRGELGRGGMAIVHLARDRTTGQDVALKLLHEHLSSQPSAVRRLDRELQASQRVDHPSVLRVQERVRVAGRLGLVLPLCTGGTLAESVETGGPWSAERLSALLQTLGGALQAAHRVGVLHRDLTPANVLLSGDGHVLLGDFGLARLHDGQTASTTALGTPGYAAPEAWGGSVRDPRSDAFSLGAVLYFAGTGRPPFGQDAPSEVLQRQLEGRPVRPLDEARPDLPPALVRTIHRLLAPSLEDRPGVQEALVGAEPVAERVPGAHTSGALQATQVGSAVSIALLVAIGWFQDLGAFLISTIVDGHALPRADVHSMTQGISALVLVPLALLPVLVGTILGNRDPSRRMAPWAVVGLLVVLNLTYALVVGVVLPQLGMDGTADIFGTMLFHQGAFLSFVALALVMSRPWLALRAPPEPPVSVSGTARADPLPARAAAAVDMLGAALKTAPDAVRVDLQDAVAALATEVETLKSRRQRLVQAGDSLGAVHGELARIEARLTRARTLGASSVDELESAHAAASAAVVQQEALDADWTATTARLLDICAACVDSSRQLAEDGDPQPVTQALATVRAGAAAAQAARLELGLRTT